MMPMPPMMPQAMPVMQQAAPMTQQMAPPATHPLDHVARQAEAQQTALMADQIAPGLREEEALRMFETMDPNLVRQLMFALQGANGAPPGDPFNMGM